MKRKLSFIAVFMLAGVLLGSVVTAQAAPAMKVHFLDLGSLRANKNDMIADQDKEAKLDLPLFALLIEHPTLGNIVYDTGIPGDWETELIDRVKTSYPVQSSRTIKEALADKGLTPDDIDLLIVSHLHFDHSGGIKYFAGTKAGSRVLLSRDAYDTVSNSDSWVKKFFLMPGIDFILYEGNLRLSDDITLFFQETHAPGLAGLMLKTKKNGTLILTNDAVYTEEVYRKKILPGSVYNIYKTPELFYKNIEMLQEMVKEHKGTLIFGHDAKQIKKYLGKTLE